MANEKMIHASNYKPVYLPAVGDVLQVQIDRAQTLTPSFTRNREKIKELGREAVVAYLPQTPTGGVSLSQLEYGSMAFFNAVANKSMSNTLLDLDDFKSTTGDFLAYLTNDDDVLIGTSYMPDYRLSGFSIAISDPKAIITRSFTFAGEKNKLFNGSNMYAIPFMAIVESGEAGDFTFAFAQSGDYINYPTPVIDPNVADKYMQRIILVRDGDFTELVDGVDYTYSNSTKILTVANVEVGDIIKGVYTAGTYITGQDAFTPNDADIGAILANSASIYLNYNNYVYKLQSVTMDVSLEREDNYEIGNKNVIQRGVNSKTVTVTLGKMQDKYTLEEFLAMQTSVVDFENMSDDAVLTVLLYNDYTKSTFKMGFKIPNLSVTDVNVGEASIDAYLSGGETLEGEEMVISTVIGNLTA